MEGTILTEHMILCVFLLLLGFCVCISMYEDVKLYNNKILRLFCWNEFAEENSSAGLQIFDKLIEDLFFKNSQNIVANLLSNTLLFGAMQDPIECEKGSVSLNKDVS